MQIIKIGNFYYFSKYYNNIYNVTEKISLLINQMRNM